VSACPSRLELSRWEARPEPARSAGVSEHVGACGRCSAVVAEIIEARSLLLGANPVETSTRAARAILAAAKSRKARRSWLRFLVPALLVPATAATLLLVKPTLNPLGLGSQPGTSIKGRLIVETYCKRGEAVFPAEDGGDFLEGDRLRIAYTQDRPGVLLVFGVDDQGRLFPYYQDRGLVGMRVTAGARVFLPGSVELDNHKGWERIFAVWSQEPIADDVMRTAVASVLSAAGGDIRHATVLDLPVEQVSLLLRRP
jgi:hypothetical protein